MTPEQVQEKDLLIGCMFLSYQIAERFMREVEKFIDIQIRESDEYKRIKKEKGIIAARECAKKVNKKIFRESDKFCISEISKDFQHIKYLMDKQTETATSVSDHYEDISRMDVSDVFLEDANYYCRIILLMSDLVGYNNNDIKIESMLKNYPKKEQFITQEILQKFTLNGNA